MRRCVHPIHVLLRPSHKSSKKLDAVVGRRTVSFGARGMSDFTLHHDPERRQRYLTRHRSREHWGRSGLTTPGFWASGILWNKPTVAASARDLERRFCLKIEDSTGRGRRA